jgi:hypothetical protein
MLLALTIADLGLMPLHLACMGCVEDVPQYKKLVEAAGSLYDLQVRGFGACWCAGVFLEPPLDVLSAGLG